MAGTLRITGGLLRNKRFQVPPTADLKELRPASDRVRAAIFSALGSLDLLQGVYVLDLFAGSGAYSFEALSRGAAFAWLVEKSPDTLQHIRQNIQQLGLQHQCQTLQGDALKILSIPLKSPLIIFADPPYSLAIPPQFWEQLPPHELVIFRCKSQADFQVPQKYQIIRERSYGGTWVVFLYKGK